MTAARTTGFADSLNACGYPEKDAVDELIPSRRRWREQKALFLAAETNLAEHNYQSSRQASVGGIKKTRK